MAQFDLIMPRMGEGVSEATVIRWLKKEGERIEMDESVIEIATDKVDSEVPSPVSGVLKKMLVREDDIVKVGVVMAQIETQVETQKPGSAERDHSEPSAPALEALPGIDLLEKASQQAPRSHAQPQIDQNAVQHLADETSTEYLDRFYSPLVRSIAQNEGLTRSELSKVKGSGAEGRVTKQDILEYLAARGKSSLNGSANGAPANKTQQHSADSKAADKIRPEQNVAGSNMGKDASDPATIAVSLLADDEIIEMDRMRRLIADHMISSQTISAHVTSFAEADVTNMVLWREQVKEEFRKREHEGITFTPIFIEALARAIKDFPMINVSVQEKKIIKHAHINIGMATNLPNGNLIVPVIKDADQKNLIGLAKKVNDLAKRARESKLLPEEIKEGTFTLTNIGGFGNLMGTPIINQPQVAILAVGAIKKKPAVMETEFGDVIAIRHKMYLSLSYDHRVVDGALGGKFLQKVVEYLEGFDLHREF